MDSLVIEGCAVATVNATAGGVITAAGTGAEYGPGHLVLAGGRITAVGAGPAPAVENARVVDGGGCLATLALSGCTTTADHHYLFPRGHDDLLAAGIGAARQIGLRLHACRGSLDVGASAGGLPPDSVTGDRDEILAATERAIEAFHDGAPDAMVRVAVAPCAPFTVSEQLMRESADLARRKGVRLHTHLAETRDEHDFCRERYGRTPVEYMESLGWLGGDVWLAHCVHVDRAGITRLGRTGTGVAHCPTSNARLGTGIAPVPELIAARAPVGLGTDGAAANDNGGLAGEMRQSLLAARARQGATALSARQALAAATMGGARCLGREDEIGSLEVGKQADVALWRVDELGQAAGDPVWALVCGPPARLELLTVAPAGGGGRAAAHRRPGDAGPRPPGRGPRPAGCARFPPVARLGLPGTPGHVGKETTMADRQRISYVPLEAMDEQMRAEMERCSREGTPRPESSAVRAHVPACFWFFARSWDEIFRHGVCDHQIKELCRVYISRSVNCEYCGNQRSVQAAAQGLTEGKYDELLNFEKSDRYTEREKAALAYAEAIAWKLPTGDTFWERMNRHFSEPELVELGCAIGLTFGQQSWLRMLNIGHHEVMPGTAASLAPGFETPEDMAATMADDDYWATR